MQERQLREMKYSQVWCKYQHFSTSKITQFQLVCVRIYLQMNMWWYEKKQQKVKNIHAANESYQ